MIPGLRLGNFEIFWLEGGRFIIDGGCMFGVVPKTLWQTKCACDDNNGVILADSAILVRTPDSTILIDTGLGNKLSAKQQEIFQPQQDWQIPAALHELGISRHDIDHVILTHGDFDHAGGVTMLDEHDEIVLTFPQARHYLQRQEWQDICAPNQRAKHTYLPENFSGLQEGKNLRLIDGEEEILPGIRLHHTGGHTRGHQVVWLTSAGERALHMGDLLPTPAFANPLWVTAYDNFPLDSISAKEALLNQARDHRAWLLLYHDPDILACKFDDKGHTTETINSLGYHADC